MTKPRLKDREALASSKSKTSPPAAQVDRASTERCGVMARNRISLASRSLIYPPDLAIALTPILRNGVILMTLIFMSGVLSDITLTMQTAIDASMIISQFEGMGPVSTLADRAHFTSTAAAAAAKSGKRPPRSPRKRTPDPRSHPAFSQMGVRHRNLGAVIRMGATQVVGALHRCR